MREYQSSKDHRECLPLHSTSVCFLCGECAPENLWPLYSLSLSLSSLFCTCCLWRKVSSKRLASLTILPFQSVYQRTLTQKMKIILSCLAWKGKNIHGMKKSYQCHTEQFFNFLRGLNSSLFRLVWNLLLHLFFLSCRPLNPNSNTTSLDFSFLLSWLAMIVNQYINLIYFCGPEFSRFSTEWFPTGPQ